MKSIPTATRRRLPMHKFPVVACAALVLALAPASGHAEWVRVSASQQTVFYIDSAKSPRVGNNVMIWVLRDHKQLQSGQAIMVRSSKDQIEIDCVGQRVRRIYSSDHLRPMGQGPMVHSEHGPMSWNNATPNSTMRRIVDVACANT